MIRLRHKLLIRLFRVMDQMVLFGVLGLIVFYLPEWKIMGVPENSDPAMIKAGDFFGFPVLAIGWIGIFNSCAHYRADRFTSLASQLRGLLAATALSTFWLLVVSFLFAIYSINTLNLMLFWVVVSAYVTLSRLILRDVLSYSRKKGFNYRYLLIIGANEEGKRIASQIESRPELGLRIVGFVAEPGAASSESDLSQFGPVLGELTQLINILERERVDEIMVCLNIMTQFGVIAAAVTAARELGIVVRIKATQEDSEMVKKLHIEEFEGNYMLTLFREQMLGQLLMKRGLDIAVSSIGLFLLVPFFLVMALLIKRGSPGPVFFVQERVGMNKRRFKLYKFRSMDDGADSRKAELQHLNERDGPVFNITDDPRVTPIGKFMRSTCIDELPQLFNVLKGEMSLVGPRPPTPDEVEKYEWLFRKRLSVKPGLTCYWQISPRKQVSFEEWMEMDQAYIDSWSVWLDLKILVMTVPVMLLKKGSS